MRRESRRHPVNRLIKPRMQIRQVLAVRLRQHRQAEPRIVRKLRIRPLQFQRQRPDALQHLPRILNALRRQRLRQHIFSLLLQLLRPRPRR
jgi:hypothetical protein